MLTTPNVKLTSSIYCQRLIKQILIVLLRFIWILHNLMSMKKLKIHGITRDKLNKEGWSPITQPNYEVCMQKINESNQRFKKIADYREIKVDINFKCECRENTEKPNEINCKPRNWFQKIYDKLFLIQ